MPTINGVFFAEDEVIKSPVRRWAPENSGLTRRLYLPGSGDADALDPAALALLGFPLIQTETVGGVKRAWVHRQLPDFYPPTATDENPFGDEYLWATSIPACDPVSRADGVDGEGRSVRPWNLFTVLYEGRAENLFEDDDVLATGDYDADLFVSPLAASALNAKPARPDEGDMLRIGWRRTRWVIKTVKPAARTVSLPQGLVQWQLVEGRGPAKEPVNQGMPYTQARLAIDYHWLCVPELAVPEDKIQLALNRVNQLQFDGRAAGTLLLADAGTKYYRTATGQRVADVSYHCLFLPNRDSVSGEYRGWNSSLRVVDGKVRCWPISGDGGAINPNTDSTNKIFQHVDFADLFRPPWPYPF